MKLLTKLATGWNILILLVLFLLAIFVAVPAIYPKFQTLDTLSTYTPNQAHQLISSYGNQGRQYYAIIEVTLDLIYPLISALLFSLLILFGFQRGFPNQRWMHQVAGLPFAVMAFDYLKNACVEIMLLAYPRLLDEIARIANSFTMIKLALTPFELVFKLGFIAWPVRLAWKKYKA